MLRIVVPFYRKTFEGQQVLLKDLDRVALLNSFLLHVDGWHETVKLYINKKVEELVVQLIALIHQLNLRSSYIAYNEQQPNL